MNRVMNSQNLRSFAYVNDKIVRMPIRGIVISFFGLNGLSMFQEDPEIAVMYAQKGILYVVPYNNPWSWMNDQAAEYTDDVLDVLFETYRLEPETPVVSTGGSMGGQQALVYMIKAKRTPVACVANCPVCDLPYHYTERPDLPRTLLSAFWHLEGSPEEALKTASPVHLADSLPDADYYIFHCDADQAVNKEKHSDRLLERMKGKRRVVYHVVAGRGHCDLTDEMRALYDGYAVQSVEKYAKA